ncbi:MAG: DUF1761 domain-containing protein [Marinilabiliales bacterium]|nr:DUF1761 domain-containing protein [Marinilabiliales bacterium]
METITVNYWAVATGAVLSMVIGAIWYGPLFGKKWAEIIGADMSDPETKKKMQKSAAPLYFVQFVMTIFQVLVLAHLIADTKLTGELRDHCGFGLLSWYHSCRCCDVDQ